MNFEYCTADPAWYEILKKNAKENRKHPTQAEAILWSFLKNSSLGLPFRQQHIIGDYIVDFICLPAKVIVEVDGDYHETTEQQKLDQHRSDWIENLGFHIIRFTNAEVICNTDAVLSTIKETIKKYE